MLTQEEARAIVEKVLSASKADDVEVAVSSDRSSNLRFARNSVSTSGSSGDTSITVSATFGKQSGSATVNQTDAKTLTEAVRRAEELARLAPPDEEYLPPPGPQEYAPIDAFAASTAAFSPDARARIAKDCIDEALAKNVVTAGFIDHGEYFSMLANNKGLRAAHRSTGITYSVTARTSDGTGSGWGGGGALWAAQFRLFGLAAMRRGIGGGGGGLIAGVGLAVHHEGLPGRVREAAQPPHQLVAVGVCCAAASIFNQAGRAAWAKSFGIFSTGSVFVVARRSPSSRGTPW